MKNPIIALFLSFIPGLGHLYIGRFIRTIFYLGGSIAIFLGTLLITFGLNGGDGAAILGLIVFVLFWGLNIVDMLITIANKQNGVFYPKPVYQNINGQMVYVDPVDMHDPLEKAQQDEKMKILLMSLIPGAAHLYMGYMKRGISILLSVVALFAIPFIIQSIFYSGTIWLLLLFIPVLIIYSIFDARYIIKSKQNDIIIEDTSIIDKPYDALLSNEKSSVALLFSLVPGFGHFVLGYAKQGLQLILSVVAMYVMMREFNLYFVRYFIVVVWAYSFFDTLYLLRHQQTKSRSEDTLLTAFSAYKKWIGLALALLGGYYIFDLFASRLLDNISMYWYNLYMYNKHLIVSGIASFVMIFVGIKFMIAAYVDKTKSKPVKK